MKTKLKDFKQLDPIPKASKNFWNDFQTQASQLPQINMRKQHVHRAWLSVPLGAATALLLVFLYHSPSANATAPSQVIEIEVATDYSGIFIVNDEEGEGTIIWIDGLDG